MKCDEMFITLRRGKVFVCDFKYDEHGPIGLSNSSPFVFCRENVYVIGMGATISRAAIYCFFQESCVLDHMKRLFSKLCHSEDDQKSIHFHLHIIE